MKKTIAVGIVMSVVAAGAVVGLGRDAHASWGTFSHASICYNDVSDINVNTNGDFSAGDGAHSQGIRNNYGGSGSLICPVNDTTLTPAPGAWVADVRGNVSVSGSSITGRACSAWVTGGTCSPVRSTSGTGIVTLNFGGDATHDTNVWGTGHYNYFRITVPFGAYLLGFNTCSSTYCN